MKTKNTYIILLLIITNISFGQTVNIPDSEFKKFLILYSGADTNKDGEIQVTEAKNFRGDINPDGFGTNDLPMRLSST